MSNFNCIPGDELAYLASTAAVALSKQFDNEDLFVISRFLSAVGSTLSMIVAQKDTHLPLIKEDSKNPPQQ